jgi:precorrin-6B methylase 2
MRLCEPKPGEVFWDLGCGAGKCMVAAALGFPNLHSVNGVEYLEGLYECAIQAGTRYKELGPVPFNLVNDDMLKVDWSAADIIFTSSICFPDELIDGIFEKCAALKPGTRIITLKQLGESEDFVMRHNLRVKMTWGKTGVYIFEKVR